MTMCTNKLNRVLLEKSDTISSIIAQWEKELDGQQLIEYWKVLFKEERKETGYEKNTKWNLITIDDSLINRV